MENILKFVQRAVLNQCVRTARGFIFYGLLLGGLGVIAFTCGPNAPFHEALLGLLVGIGMLVLWVRIVYSRFLESLE